MQTYNGGRSLTVDDKVLEKKLLIHRVYSEKDIFAIGKEQKISYFDQFVNVWEVDTDEASLEIGQTLNDKQIEEVFKKYPARNWAVFRGEYYTFEDSTLKLRGSIEKI